MNVQEGRYRRDGRLRAVRRARGVRGAGRAAHRMRDPGHRGADRVRAGALPGAVFAVRAGRLDAGLARAAGAGVPAVRFVAGGRRPHRACPGRYGGQRAADVGRAGTAGRARRDSVGRGEGSRVHHRRTRRHDGAGPEARGPGGRAQAEQPAGGPRLVRPGPGGLHVLRLGSGKRETARSSSAARTPTRCAATRARTRSAAAPAALSRRRARSPRADAGASPGRTACRAGGVAHASSTYPWVCRNRSCRRPRLGMRAA
ncbi:hypothetical protein SALBM311S_00719 [Streptomyces alboniger]